MESWLKKVWEHKVTSWILVSLGFAIAVFFILHSPIPGVAVTVLGAVAAIMSIRPLSSWEKFFYTALVFSLLYAEIHAITVDRREQLRHQLEDRAAQDKSFKDVRDAQDKDFSVTAKGLETAITGIQSTLTTSNKTLVLTQPHAALRLDKFELYPTPAPQDKFEPNKDYIFNYYYGNGGAATASAIKVLAKIYIAKADNRASEREIAEQFEQAWKAGEAKDSYAVIVPNYVGFSSMKRDLTVQEIKDLDKHGTFYLLVRFEFSDNTGRWRTDGCRSFQRDSNDTSLDINLIHTCSTFERFRYPVSIKLQR